MNHRALFLLPFLLAACLLPASPPVPGLLNSGLEITHDPVGETFLLSWWGTDSTFYFVEQSSDLVGWNLVPVFEAGKDDPIQWGFATTADRLFLRLRHTDDPGSALMRSDLDGDGLSVYEEYLIGSDPFNPDTSGDGIFDGIAYKLGLPVVPPTPPAPDPSDITPPAISLTSPASAILLP